MAMNGTAIHSHRTANIFDRAFLYFKDRGALSEDKAITIEDADWIDIFGSRVSKDKSLKLMSYIKVTPSGKYWTSVELFEEYMKQTKKKGKCCK